MNILIYRYGSICEPDVITGFEELGNHVHEITAEIYNKDLLPSEGVTLLKNELLAHSYDFVFSINFFPLFLKYAISFRSAIFAGPWTVRLWNYTPIPSKSMEPHFLFDLAQYNEFSPKNPDCIFHLPLASNPARWKRVISHATPADIRRFSSDISFVGSLYTENRLMTDSKIHLPI